MNVSLNLSSSSRRAKPLLNLAITQLLFTIVSEYFLTFFAVYKILLVSF